MEKRRQERKKSKTDNGGKERKKNRKARPRKGEKERKTEKRKTERKKERKKGSGMKIRMPIRIQAQMVGPKSQDSSTQ